MKAAAETTPKDDALVFECDLDASPEKVWRALTVPELMAAWLDDEAAGPVADDGAVDCELVHAEPFSHVRYAWREGEEAGPDSSVLFELWPRPAGRTRLRVTHTIQMRRQPLTAANGNAPAVARAA